MPAGDQEQEIGEVQVLHEARGQRVRLEVVDGDQRQLVHQGDRLGREQPHHQPADQPRPGSGGDAGQIAEAETRLGHGLGHEQVELLDMGAGCYLGDHAAVGGVLGELGEQGAASTRRSARTRAAAVSSQLVSIPSTMPSSRTSPALQVRRARCLAHPPRTGHDAPPAPPPRHPRLAPGPGAGADGQGGAAAAEPELAADEAVEIVVVRTTGDRISGPPAGRDRRQGPVHRGDRGGAARRHARSRRALDEGHADRPARRAGHQRGPAAGRSAGRADRPRARAAWPSCPHGAVVGTASLRRAAQLRAVDRTSRSCRCAATSRQAAQARGRRGGRTFLAMAGLLRLDLEREVSAALEPEEMLPAVAQGAIGIECRADDPSVLDLCWPRSITRRP